MTSMKLLHLKPCELNFLLNFGLKSLFLFQFPFQLILAVVKKLLKTLCFFAEICHFE